MNELYLIIGPIGVKTSTVSKFLAENYDIKYVLDIINLAIDETVNTIINDDCFWC